MMFDTEKPKNDDKPKGRPRRPMLLIALAMIAIGVIGILWSVSKSQTPPPTAITSYEVEVQTYTQQTTTITTSSYTTTITSLQPSAGNGESANRLNEYLAPLLNSLEAMQSQPPTPR
jgi:hypothetical protein